jgi:hypothetical protein
MTPKQILDLVLLGEQAVGPILELVLKLKSQSGLSDSDLLDLAEKEDGATRERVAIFLARVNS